MVFDTISVIGKSFGQVFFCYTIICTIVVLRIDFVNEVSLVLISLWFKASDAVNLLDLIVIFILCFLEYR